MHVRQPTFLRVQLCRYWSHADRSDLTLGFIFYGEGRVEVHLTDSKKPHPLTR